jgi:hypothetical protein
MRWTAVGMLASAACAGSGGNATPADCAALPVGPAADACYVETAVPAFRADPVAADAAVQSRVQDAQLRDFIYLTVTREVDPTTPRWCDKMGDRTLKERCMVLVSRPHLHRELLGGQGGPPPGGSPPPGGGPPPGGSPPPPGGAPPPGGSPPPGAAAGAAPGPTAP